MKIASDVREIERRLAEAEATVAALVAGHIDTVTSDHGPLLLAEAQAALRASEARLAATLDSIGDGVVAADLSGRVTLMNPVAVDLTGWPVSEARGRPIHDIFKVVAEDTHEPLPLSVEAIVAGQASVAVQGQLVGRGGGHISVAQTCAPIRTPEGGVIGIVIAFRDITSQRELHARLRIADRMASMGMLAAGVAHEINNPLAVLIGNLEILGHRLASPSSRLAACFQRSVSDDTAELLADVQESAERIRAIVQELRSLTRVEDDRRRPLKIPALLDSSLRMARLEIRHRARVVRDFGPTPDVDANEARLGQLFLNLIVNAAQAMPEGRANENELRVSTRTSPRGEAVVEIRDTGAGIPAAMIPRIFDPFFTTKRAGQGTGLGLAICQRIVNECHGQLQVQSAVGKGTVVTVTLPAVPQNADPSRPSPAEVVASSRPGRVLVIDDEPLVQAMIRRVLAHAHDVVVETRAEDALARLAVDAGFDVILCDVMMPEMTGLQFYEHLRARHPPLASRVVFMTGGALAGQTATRLENTGNPMLEKPFEQGQLRALLEKLLR